MKQYNRKEYAKEYYQKNKEKIKATSIKNYFLDRDDRIKKSKIRYKDINNYKQIILERARSRAKSKGVVCTIKTEDIIIPDICPIFGFELKRSFSGKAEYNSPSVDRIVPDLGYTKDNIMVLSYKANMMKNNATEEELVKFANWILNGKKTKEKKGR